ncbi:MAG TPA: STAS domain-containing protein [Gemmataceae bacterium]|nr:STAS domain-containing protein [Gemmataceae bacterium]
MISRLDQHYLHVEQIGDVTVVTFNRSEFLDETTIRLIGEQLFHLAQKSDRPLLVLNVAAVKKLSTMMLGHFITLHKKARAAGGRLVLCRLDPQLHEAFDMLRVGQIIPIYAEEQDALQAF